MAKSADFTLGIDNLGDCFDKIDILINCAGVYLEKSLDNLTDNDYEEIFDVNLKTPFKLIKEVSINMKNNRWGRILKHFVFHLVDYKLKWENKLVKLIIQSLSSQKN